MPLPECPSPFAAAFFLPGPRGRRFLPPGSARTCPRFSYGDMRPVRRSLAASRTAPGRPGADTSAHSLLIYLAPHFPHAHASRSLSPKTLPLLLIAMLVLALSCTPKDRRNRMTWVKPGNGYVLKDPVLAAKLKNLPTEIVDSGYRYSMRSAIVRYFACDVVAHCSESFKKTHGERSGIIGNADFEISPIEKGLNDEAKSKRGSPRGSTTRVLKIQDISIVQIHIVFNGHVYLPNLKRCKLRIDDSAVDQGLGSIEFFTPVGPFWDDWRTGEKTFIVVEFLVGGKHMMIRSIPLRIAGY